MRNYWQQMPNQQNINRQQPGFINPQEGLQKIIAHNLKNTRINLNKNSHLVVPKVRFGDTDKLAIRNFLLVKIFEKIKNNNKLQYPIYPQYYQQHCQQQFPQRSTYVPSTTQQQTYKPTFNEMYQFQNSINELRDMLYQQSVHNQEMIRRNNFDIFQEIDHIRRMIQR